jgi:catechol O-methyltransferase
MDAFTVFGDDEEPPQLLRDPDCGVLTHHLGTEQALLVHVQQQQLGFEDGNKLARVLSAIDNFCLARHWMMHVGPEKGATLESFLDQSVEDFLLKPILSDDGRRRPFIVVELGTYCGYSAIRMASKILKRLSGDSFHIFTVDINPDSVQIARQLVSLAGVENYVSFVVRDDDRHCKTRLSDALNRSMNETLAETMLAAGIDFLFLDHDKNAYLPDLLELEQTGLIRARSHVAADNVIFFKLDSYRQHVSELSERGVVTTRIERGVLEYVNDGTRRQEGRLVDLQDGIGK